MTGSQVVEKFLPEIRDRLGVEHKQIGFRVNDDAVGLRDSRRDVHLGRGRRFVKGRVDFLGHLEVRLEKQNAAGKGGFVSGMARRGVVHNEIGEGICPPGCSRATP
jgi:hypothetical protein